MSFKILQKEEGKPGLEATAEEGQDQWWHNNFEENQIQGQGIEKKNLLSVQMRKKGKPKKKKLLSGFLAQKTVYFMADNFKAEGIYLQRILQICQMSLFSILPRKIPIGAKGLKNL